MPENRQLTGKMAKGGRRSTSWKPGVCPNPGGRPKQLASVRDLAREKTEKAISTLVSVMDGRKSPPNARVAAAVALLDRGWGRPPQAMELSASEKDNRSFSWDLSKLTDKELEVLKELGEKATMSGTVASTPAFQGRPNQ